MNKTWLLYRTMFHDGFSLSLKTKRGRRNLLVMLLVLVIGGVYIGLYGALILFSFQSGQSEVMLRSLLMIISMILVLMLFATFPSTYYFSKDLPVLLAMPLRAKEIINAKTLLILSMIGPLLLAVVITMTGAAALSGVFSVLQCVLMFGYGIFTGLSTIFILAGVIILMMRFLPFFRSKDKFMTLFGIMTVVLVLVMMSAIYGNPEMMSQANNDAHSSAAMFNALGGSIPIYLFPSAWAAFEGILRPSLLNFGINVAILAGSYLLFQFLASKFYLVAATNAVGSSPKKRKAANKDVMNGSMASLLAKVEIDTLVRTPAYLTNNVLGAFILPIAFMVPIYFVFKNTEIDSAQLSLMINAMLKTVNLPMFWAAMLVGMVIGYMVGGSTATTQTAITRGGRAGLAWMKSVPVPIEKQLQAKINVAMILAILSSLIMIGGILFFIGFQFFALIGALLGAIVPSYLSCQTSLLMDIYHPKLDWQDEAQAVKNNLNVFLGMFASFLMGVIIFVAAWLIYSLSNSLVLTIATVFVIQVVMIGLLWKQPVKWFHKYLDNVS
ncbi:hypothetical protein IM774_01510 [Erysipelotrichaceae bacterium RD49]|nr:hypothetical protein [Erysipelotrichaceae bacterium RD49]